MSNFTQPSRLELKTKLSQSGKTLIEEVFFTPPFKIIDCFDADSIAEIMLLSVSAGLMSGDTQEIEIEIGTDSALRLSSQSFEKIHDTSGGLARRTSHIKLERGAYLDFSPFPTIPFAHSHFINSTSIEMAADSRLSYSEIFCAGRVSRGEIFEFEKYHSRLQIAKQNKLIFLDNTYLEPKCMNLRDMCHFWHFTHFLNWILIDDCMSAESLRKRLLALRDLGGINASLSTNKEVIIIKALAHDSETLLHFKQELQRMP